MDEFAFFYQASDDPPDAVPDGVEVVRIDNRADPNRFSIRHPWRRSGSGMVPLQKIADIRNGQHITEADAKPGGIPVIGGGAGTIPYFHDQANVDGACITISKSGANAGYVWWHETPVWAKDCLVIQSQDEAKFSTFYLYLCLRACQEELFARQQGTGQPHFYDVTVADFPVPDLMLAAQQAKIDDSRLAIQEQLAAQAWADATMHDAVQSVDTLYQPTSEASVASDSRNRVGDPKPAQAEFDEPVTWPPETQELPADEVVGPIISVPPPTDTARPDEAAG